ncbi:MAG: hypothetical protein ACK50V_05660 [Alphaproteobacteria bacterium]|nr:hypothetical protein [Alphaproteobacteria bacterium]
MRTSSRLSKALSPLSEDLLDTFVNQQTLGYALVALQKIPYVFFAYVFNGDFLTIF